MTEKNDTTPAPRGASSARIDDTLKWFDEDRASLETIAANAVSSGLGFPEGAFRQIACDLAVLSDAVQHDEALNPEIAAMTIMGIEHRARAAWALCQPRGHAPTVRQNPPRPAVAEPEVIEYGGWKGTLNQAANSAQAEIVEAIAYLSTVDNGGEVLGYLASALSYVRAIEENTLAGGADRG